VCSCNGVQRDVAWFEPTDPRLRRCVVDTATKYEPYARKFLQNVMYMTHRKAGSGAVDCNHKQGIYCTISGGFMERWKISAIEFQTLQV
uniref:Uncharacterized protein n=1 Tax=Physcomitrium patens TaxID=3218 RepID=A0A7I4BTU9_PHYPA